MGLLQDFLRNLRERNKQPSLDELHDDRTRDRQLLLLRKEYRELQEQKEKAALKERLRFEYKKKMSNEFFGFKTPPTDKVQIIKALHKKTKPRKSGYLGKFNLR